MNSKRPPYRPAVFTPFWRRFTDERAHDLRKTIRLHKEVSDRWRASLWAKPGVVASLARHTLARIAEHAPLPAYQPVLVALTATVEALLAQESTIFTTPEIDWSKAHLSLKDQIDLRRFLRAQQHFLANDERVIGILSDTVFALLLRIIAAMPSIDAHATGVLTTPLIDRMARPAELIDHILTDLADDEVVGAGLCVEIRDHCYRNACAFSGIPPYEDSRKPIITPSKAGLPAAELAQTYLANTPFLDLLRISIPFFIPRRAFRAHGCVFGPSDHGKTQTLQAIIAGFLNEPDPPALIIMDSMGAMLKKLERLALFDGRLKDRLVVLDPAGENQPKLNFFKLAGGTPAQQMELLFYLFKALDQSLTARQRTTVTFLAQLMQRIDGTLDDLRQVCEAKQPQHLDAINNLSPIARDFFLNAFYKPDALMTQTKQQIAARLYTLAATPIFSMFSAKENAFNAFECIQQKKIVLVNTDRLALGDDGSAIFGRYVLAQCLAAAFARAPIPEEERHLALCIVDEAKAYFDEQTERFLSDARQFGLGLLFGTQYVSQLSEGVRRAVYGNTAIKLIGPIEYSDRVSLAREMNTTPEFIGAMRSYDNSHTEWAAHVRTSNMTPSAIKLCVPFGILERMPKADHLPDRVLPQSAQGPHTQAEQILAHQQTAHRSDAVAQSDEPFVKPGKRW